MLLDKVAADDVDAAAGEANPGVSAAPDVRDGAPDDDDDDDNIFETVGVVSAAGL
jgi:hypothetical protein